MSDQFGVAGHINDAGNIIAVGAPGISSTTTGNSSGGGYVYVYSYNDTTDTWDILGDYDDYKPYIFYYEETSYGFSTAFGSSVRLSGSGYVLAISELGSVGENESTITNVDNIEHSGNIYVYEYDSTSWILKHKIERVWGIQNYALSLTNDGSTVAFARSHSPSQYFSTFYAAVEIYQVADASYTQVGGNIYPGEDVISNLAMNDSGTIIALGEKEWDNNKGRVQVYEYQDSSWVNVYTVNGVDDNDYFGFSVDLNSEGTVLSAGGHYANYVELHRYISGEWQLYTADVITAPNDASYKYLSLIHI